MKLTSRTALMVSGAVASFVRPLLAADAKVDLTDVFEKTNAETIAQDGADAALAAEVITLVTPHLAADQTIDADALTAAIAAVPPVLAADDAIEIADPVKPAPVAKPTPVTMDAAERQAIIDDAKAAAAAESAAIRTAERDVEPFVGKVIAQDSAAAVYKIALDHLKVDLTDVPEEGYGGLLRAMPKPDAKRPRIAQDAKPANGALAAIAPDARIPTAL